MYKVVSGNRIDIDSLQHLLTLVELVAPNQLTIASDILGKNKTVFLRAGKPLSTAVLNFLKNNESYIPEFSIEANPELCSGCTGILLKKIENLVVTEKINALTRAVTTLKAPLPLLLLESFKERRLLLTFFALHVFGDEGDQWLFEHSLLVGILTLGIAGELDERFKKTPYSTEAFQTGLIHDSTIPDYLERIDTGQEAIEEPTHAAESADLAAQWGLPSYCVEAIRRHHKAFNEGKEVQKPVSDEESVLTVALATAERFATACDLLGRTKENEACFMVAHLADQGKLDKHAVRALGFLIHAKQIVSDVERLSQIESLCPNLDAAYVYPKVVHATPTKVVCRGNIEDCPLFISSEPPLVVLNQAGETSLADGMFALPPGEYRKCALSTKLAEANV